VIGQSPNIAESPFVTCTIAGEHERMACLVYVAYNIIGQSGVQILSWTNF